MDSPDGILGIDPGTVQSALAAYYPDSGRCVPLGIQPNSTVFQQLPALSKMYRLLALERIRGYGMAVGKEVFETAEWTGMFRAAWGTQAFTWVERREVKLFLCGQPTASDSNIACAVRDLCGPKGTKKDPGPTYGFAKDQWQALAAAVTAAGRE